MPKKGKIRVLMVDDEERFRDTTSKLLEKRGFDVKCAGGGEEALRMLGDEEIDVVVLDVGMPGMKGDRVVREIRNTGATAGVILLTGQRTPDSMVDTLEWGAYDYLQKPCPVEVLARRIKDAAAKDRSIVQNERQVRDIMVPLNRFPAINQDDTVEKAVDVIRYSYTGAMESSSEKEVVSRSALVMDERKKIRGVLSFIDIFKEIQPPYMRLGKGRPTDRCDDGPPDFTGLFTLLVREVAKKKVKNMMSGPSPEIDADENLLAAMNQFIKLNARRLIVTEKGKPVGVLREQDLFFELTNIIRTRGM